MWKKGVSLKMILDDIISVIVILVIVAGIIIPSYDSDNSSITSCESIFEKNLNIKISCFEKCYIFENQINWNEPITLVEGVFDVPAKKVIPILGKFVPKKLNDGIFKNELRVLIFY